MVQSKINDEQNLWIAKPGGLSRGRNIKLFNNFQEILNYCNAVPDSAGSTFGKDVFGPKTWIVQKYIENPLLILNRKFDIRVWVLVSSWNPLKIHLYHDCYIRFSATDYSSNNIKNLFSHLTNNSISKNCTDKQSAYF